MKLRIGAMAGCPYGQELEISRLGMTPWGQDFFWTSGKSLAEFDAGGGDTRLVLSRDEIAELMRVFLPDGTNEARLIDQVDATITKVVDLGFLRRLKPAGVSAQDRGHYEVRRILNAFVDAQWLAEFDARLEVYRTALSAASGESIDKAAKGVADA